MACGRWEVGCPLPPPARSALAGSVRRPQTRHGRAEGDPGMPEPGGTGRVHPGERPRVAARAARVVHSSTTNLSPTVCRATDFGQRLCGQRW